MLTVVGYEHTYSTHPMKLSVSTIRVKEETYLKEEENRSVYYTNF